MLLLIPHSRCSKCLLHLHFSQCWSILRPGSEGSQPDVVQRIPALRLIILHISIGVSARNQIAANTSHNLIDGRLVDEILEAESIWVCKFELVIVGKKSQKRKSVVALSRVFELLEELESVSRSSLAGNRIDERHRSSEMKRLRITFPACYSE